MQSVLVAEEEEEEEAVIQRNHQRATGLMFLNDEKKNIHLRNFKY
jgi:hypothetical protein